MHGSFHKMLRESIHESQKCQRNWDLTKEIAEKDKELIVEAATNSPSKQNLNYFKLPTITPVESLMSPPFPPLTPVIETTLDS